MIAIISDNGGQLYNHPNQNPPFRGWKTGFFEGGIRVPAMFQWEGRIPPATLGSSVTSFDVLPTILDLLDIAVSMTVMASPITRSTTSFLIAKGLGWRIAWRPDQVLSILVGSISTAGTVPVSLDTPTKIVLALNHPGESTGLPNDDGIAELYIDGALYLSLIYPDPIPRNSLTVEVGNNLDLTQPFFGTISGLSFFNVSLTREEALP